MNIINSIKSNISNTSVIVGSIILPTQIGKIIIPILLMKLLIEARKNILKYLFFKLFFILLISGGVIFTLYNSPTELIRFAPIISIALLFPYEKININGINSITLIGLIYIFSFQILIAIEWGFAINIRDILYPIENDPWSKTSHEFIANQFRSIRAAGIYYNPNVAASVTAFFGILHYYASKYSEEKKFLTFVQVIAIVSIYLTGSRTYLVAYILFLLLSSSRNLKYIIPIGAIVTIISAPFILEYYVNDFYDSSGSMYIKLNILKEYIIAKSESHTLIDLLFGGTYGIHFDSDLGYIIGGWGIFGFLSVLLYTTQFAKHHPRTIPALIPIIATGFGNSLFFGLVTGTLMIVLMITFTKSIKNGK